MTCLACFAPTALTGLGSRVLQDHRGNGRWWQCGARNPTSPSAEVPPRSTGSRGGNFRAQPTWRFQASKLPPACPYRARPPPALEGRVLEQRTWHLMAGGSGLAAGLGPGQEADRSANEAAPIYGKMNDGIEVWRAGRAGDGQMDRHLPAPIGEAGLQGRGRGSLGRSGLMQGPRATGMTGHENRLHNKCYFRI